jgi:hypothetical protein
LRSMARSWPWGTKLTRSITIRPVEIAVGFCLPGGPLCQRRPPE